MDKTVVRRVEALRRSSVPELKREYSRVFGEATSSSHKQYLFRRIAWQLQAHSDGGLSERAQHRAAQIADDADLRLGGPKGFWSWPDEASVARPLSERGQIRRDERLPEPGTLLKRRHQGNEIVVRVLEQGFEYQSRQYRSLSAVARQITGTRWNGLLFFGLTGRRDG
jgi:Protein of unknown function (DUF2924)